MAELAELADGRLPIEVPELIAEPASCQVQATRLRYLTFSVEIVLILRRNFSRPEERLCT